MDTWLTLLPKFELNIEFQNGFQDRNNQDTAMRVAPNDAREKTASICKKNVLSSHKSGWNLAEKGVQDVQLPPTYAYLAALSKQIFDCSNTTDTSSEILPPPELVLIWWNDKRRTSVEIFRSGFVFPTINDWWIHCKIHESLPLWMAKSKRTSADKIAPSKKETYFTAA